MTYSEVAVLIIFKYRVQKDSCGSVKAAIYKVAGKKKGAGRRLAPFKFERETK